MLEWQEGDKMQQADPTQGSLTGEDILMNSMKSRKWSPVITLPS